jgi:hypothetical protein
MRKFLVFILVLIITVFTASFAPAETAVEEESSPSQEASGEEVQEESSPSQEASVEGAQEGSLPFTISRFLIAGSVEDREPVGVVNVFASTTEKVYCFLEGRDITKTTIVSAVWFFEEKEVARVDLALKEGSRWRTYSSKKLAGLSGDWKVELQDAKGNILQTSEFKVE